VGLVSESLDALSLRAEPNPFAQSTRLSFALPSRGTVRVTVLDVSGRAIRTLVDGEMDAGRGSVEWDGRDESGNTATSGVYFFRIESAGNMRTVKGTLLR
jgi:flagellar hook assembly protein FlgD